MVRLRAFGNYGYRIQDSQLFVNTVVGSQGVFETSRLEDFYRDIIVSRLNDLMGETLKTIFDLPKYYDELGTAAKARVIEDFAKYGVEEDEFNQLYSSFGVSTKLRQTDALARDYQIRGVPSFVVNGKYLILRDGLRNNQEMFDVIDFLVKKERR